MKKTAVSILSVVFVMAMCANVFGQEVKNDKSLISSDKIDYKVEIKGEYVLVIDGIEYNVKKLADDNDVDADELKAALIAGPDKDGKFSPYSQLRRLGNKTDEELSNVDKRTSNGKPFSIERKDFQPAINNQVMESSQAAGYVYRSNQATTAYVWTGNKTASGVWPYITSFACHKYSNGKPYMPFGTRIHLDRFIWTPDNYYYALFVCEDTGTGRSNDWWVDFYYGNDRNQAIQYGVRTLSYNQEI